MTVMELIEALRGLDPRLNVVGEWDGGYSQIDSVRWDTVRRLVALDVSRYRSFDD